MVGLFLFSWDVSSTIGDGRLETKLTALWGHDYFGVKGGEGVGVTCGKS